MISNVNYNPQSPQEGDNVVVTASAIDVKASISQISLNYSVGGGAYSTLSMMLNQSVYEAVIPKQPNGTTVEFYISASDSEGNTKETNKFSYTVGQGFQIPGFPWESIIVGLVVGVAILIFFMRRKSNLPKPTTSTSPSL
jgi:hypothetical protein